MTYPENIQELQDEVDAGNPYAWGVVPSAPKVEQYTVEKPLVYGAASSRILPSYKKVPVLNQEGGTCVGNSIAGGLMHLQYMDIGRIVPFNGEELNARATHEFLGPTSFTPVMDIIMKTGIKSGEALYFPAGYANVDYKDVGAMKTAIDTPGQVVVFATWLPAGWDANATGFAPAFPENNGGLHAMLIVGYDARGVLVQNSWSENFADKGFIRLSWDFVTHHFVEAMAITDKPDIAGGYVKTYDVPDLFTERAVKHNDARPEVYLVKGNGRFWIKDIWEAKRFGVDLTKVEKLPDTNPVWAIPVIGMDAYQYVKPDF